MLGNFLFNGGYMARKKKERLIEFNFKLTARQRDEIFDLFAKTGQDLNLTISYPDRPTKAEIEEDKRLYGQA